MPEILRPAELSFFSLTERLAQISHQRDPLQRLDGVIDWKIFQPVLDRVFPPVTPKGHGGRPAYPKLFLCKILVLQRLYHLSDEATQFQILDRLSFQRFLGLSLSDPVPDQNTIREFREALQKAVRGRELNGTEKEENREISRARARVEHAFAVMSGQAGRIFERYVGWARNQAAIQMIYLCYNLKRYETILRLKLHPVANS